jgi:hypothetical protein
MVDPTKLKNRIARIIAATRFPFVDQENWSDGNTTMVNDETRRYGIKWEMGILYPSIVVANPDGSIREFGLVEGAEDISEGSLERWRALSDVAPYGREHKKLFLYVPEGYEERTLSLLEGNGIDYDGIRAYRVEKQSLKILPFKTQNDEYDHTVT